MRTYQRHGRPHCTHGHLKSAENVLIRLVRGYIIRECRICGRLRALAYTRQLRSTAVEPRRIQR